MLVLFQDDDQGLFFDGGINIVPTDGNGVTFSRTPQQVGISAVIARLRGSRETDMVVKA